MPKWTRHQTMKQLEIVELLLVKGIKSHRVLAANIERLGFGSVSHKRCASLIQRVQDVWAAEDSGNREQRRAAAVRRLYEHLERSRGVGKPGDTNYVKPSWHAVTQIEDLLSKIEGTQEPSRSKLEVNNSFSQSLSYVIGSMTAEQVRAYVAEQEEIEVLAEVQKQEQTQRITQFIGANDRGQC